MVSIFISVMMFMASFIPLLGQPLSLGAVILVLAVVFSIAISYFVSSWYGYILFIIYVGALLVMFSYAVVLAYNPNMELFSWKFYFFSLLFVFMLFVMFYSSDLEESVGFTIDYDCYFNGVSMSSAGGVFSLIGLGVFLLLCLVVVVKISLFRGSPFRFFKMK
nr:NADH dehydrogenase subunit 6 [Cuspidaria undata]USF19200.1 NADH dehydrogenase subunit 6 [Cuspidaria undata]